jgi:BlaI family transcriptional regulator, penicillinase repressor
MITKTFVDNREESMRQEKDVPNPTPAELAILRVLWQRGPSTVREIQEAMSADRATGYTTILKLLQIMTEKGLAVREEVGRAHVYQARQSEEQAQRQIVGDLLDRVFGGAAQRMVMQALTERRASPEDIAEIRRLLDRLEGEES